MKKKYIQLGAVALVLVALVAALVLLRAQPEPVKESETPVAETVYIYGNADMEMKTPRQIDVHNEFGDAIIDNITPADAPAAVSAELTVRGWEELSLDTYGLGQAASNAAAMRAKEVISENATAEELSTFGLDNPRAKITVELQDGSKHVILFGINAPGSEGVYVKTQDGNAIYLISDSTALPYFKPATAYVNKTITGTDPEYIGFDKITLSGANYPEPLVIERTPETELEGAGVIMNTHSFTSPVMRNIDTTRGYEPLTAVYGLLANDVVAVDDSAETLAKYGLDDPATIISVVSEDKPDLTFTLRISKPGDNGEVHLIKDGSKVIYELSASALPFLDKTMFDMMDRIAVMPNIQTVDKIIFKTTDKSYEFVLTQEDDGKKLDVTSNGVMLPDVVDENGKAVTGGENFRKLYQTMISCRYDEEMPKASTVEDFSGGEPGVTDESESDVSEADMLDPETVKPMPAEPDSGILEVPETDAAGAAPEVTDAKFLASIEYVYNNGQTSDVLSFYEGPSRKVEVRLNGVSGYYTQSIYFDRLLEDVEKVNNGIAVKSYL